MSAILTARNISRSFGSLPVLKGVDLDVEEREVISIAGASGAGKSTLLYILGTLDQPDEGEVTIQDNEITGLSGKKLAEFRNSSLGFIFQFHNLLPEFTCLENVCLPGWLGKKNEKEVRERSTELLEILGLGDRIDHKPSQLSGGEQQRTAVARALVNNPKIVFADEPSGNLDSKNARELHELFFKLREDLGQTFVLVTHNEELAKMADRQLYMKDGNIV